MEEILGIPLQKKKKTNRKIPKKIRGTLSHTHTKRKPCLSFSEKKKQLKTQIKPTIFDANLVITQPTRKDTNSPKAK